jgi:hypothetical protein
VSVKRYAGAKGRRRLQASMARLKPCPDTKPRQETYCYHTHRRSVGPASIRKVQLILISAKASVHETSSGRGRRLFFRFDEGIADGSAVSRPSNPSSLFRLETAVGHENYITACTFGATDGRGAQDTGRRTGRD